MNELSDHELDRAFESGETKLVLERVRSENERAILKREVLGRRSEMALDIAEVRDAAEQAQRRTAGVNAQISADVYSGRHALRLGLGITILLLIAAMWAARTYGAWQWTRSLTLDTNSIWGNPIWLLVICGIGIGGLLLLLWELAFFLFVAPTKKRRLEKSQDIAGHVRAATAASQRLRKRIATVVAGYLSEAIQGRAAPAFGVRVQISTPGQTEPAGRNAAIAMGLSEVVNEENIISTAPRRRILEMIEQLPGGSIGISGPRGVGKSTLLNAVCRSRSEPGYRRVIAVSTAAPVEYQARDFLLHLFSSLCRQVLKEEGVDTAAAERQLAESEMAAWQRTSWQARSRSATVALMLVSFASFLTAAAIWLVSEISIGGTQAPVVQTKAASPIAEAMASLGYERWQEAAKLAQQQAADQNAGSSATPPAKLAEAAPVTETAPVVAAAEIKPFGVSLAPFLALGIFMLTLSVILMMTDPRSTLMRAGGSARARQSAATMSALRFTLKRAIVERSVEELRIIRFQRSYTSGWSGSVKFPAGLDIGAMGTLALQQQAESFPELVDRFRLYVADVVAAYGTVVFGIDELDKLRSASEGEAFLNGVKSIFGIANCFYLISVSEDALSAFDRRGIGIRDAFDSALDEIIHVDFLSIPQSRSLLSRRIMRLPDPFLLLCHMLSGGLPRDLIRHARQLAEIAVIQDERKISLRDAVQTLVANDLAAKLRATQVAIRALKELPKTNELLTKISEIEADAPLAHLTAQYLHYRDFLGELGRTSDDERRLARLADELAVFIGTMLLVRQTARTIETRVGWAVAEQHGLCAEVARVRQALEVSVPLAEARLTNTMGMFSAIEADISRVSAEQKRERAAKRTRREAAAKSETGSTRRKGKAFP